jgi:5-methylcytosine-specific restriction enzyme A
MSSKEKDKARQLRKSQWWQAKLSKGVCHYCSKTFSKEELTMDHKLPLARGGKSTKGNLVVSCKACNSDKKYLTPAELILRNQMGKEISF